MVPDKTYCIPKNFTCKYCQQKILAKYKTLVFRMRSVKREALDLVGNYFHRCKTEKVENKNEFANLLDQNTVSDSESTFSSFSDCGETDEGMPVQQYSFREELAQWAIMENIGNSSVNSLLKILRKLAPLCKLPAENT